MRSRPQAGQAVGRAATRGFTLIETLITVAILAVVLGGVYQLFLVGYRTQAVVSTDSSFLDNARRAVDAMAKDLHVAGLDPTGAGVFGFRDSGGFAPVATEARILFSLDEDRDGTLDANALERVGFLLNGTTLVRTMDGVNPAAGLPPVARDVASLRFEYFDASDNPIPNPPGATYTLTAAQRRNIRRIRVTVTYSGTAGSLARTYSVTTDIRGRNL